MCSNLLCLPVDLVDLIYFYILLIANTLNCLIAIASVYLVIRRRCCPRVRSELAETTPPVSVIVPCYLPNEQAIIESTIDHIMLRLEWPGPLNLHVVYNTPSDLPIEQRLRDLDGREYMPGRTLRVTRVRRSASKAENLNHILPTIKDEFVALYDADHHPDALSLRQLHLALEASSCVAMQGSTYIRNAKGSFLGRAVDAEFLVTHFIYFPAMEVLGGTAYFGGSNAMWRTTVLQQYPFNASMLTEDVDVSARALLDGHRIGFSPKARSGELSPSGVSSLVTQRLRWFMGWEQVTHQYYWRVFVTRLSLWRKLGFCYLFHLRWLLLFAAVLAAVINPVITSPFVYPLFTWSVKIQVCVYTAISLYAFVALLALHAAVTHEWPRRPMAVLATALFFVGGWIYVILHFTLQSIAFLKVFCRLEGRWEVTSRFTGGVSPPPLSDAGHVLRRATPNSGRALTQPLLDEVERAEALEGAAAV